MATQYTVTKKVNDPHVRVTVETVEAKPRVVLKLHYFVDVATITYGPAHSKYEKGQRNAFDAQARRADEELVAVLAS